MTPHTSALQNNAHMTGLPKPSFEISPQAMEYLRANHRESGTGEAAIRVERLPAT